MSEPLCTVPDCKASNASEDDGWMKPMPFIPG